MNDPATNQNLERFLTREQIQQRVQQLGAEISRDFAGQSLVLVGVLKGAAIFLADLARAITVDCTFDFISISSYGEGLRSSGTVRLIKNINHPIESRNVILVEDILDTGVTLCYLQNLLLVQNPVALKIVTLLDKPSRRLQKIEADYVGFTIPNRFVIGYGMDCAERYRNLPDIYFMPADVQEE
jgi:hypoxanthine phosphoribosyltransferase